MQQQYVVLGAFQIPEWGYL